MPVPFLWLSLGTLPLRPLPAGIFCLCNFDHLLFMWVVGLQLFDLLSKA
uniref:Uncharacterized protein n=1 Tax=Anguilla anguilla TaxID=7936 RepID=A0A0E9Q3V7_ANGAN